VRLGAEGPRVVRWQMYGDQGPGWKSADIELNIISVTEVCITDGTGSHFVTQRPRDPVDPVTLFYNELQMSTYMYV